MKIIILFHSQSGTTLEFAERIASKLKEGNHTVQLTQLQTNPTITSGSVRHTKSFTITNLPDIKDYDLILLGGPVWAFSASPIAVAALDRLGDLSGKKVLPFLTQGLHPSLGGKRAIALLGKMAAKAGATVLPGKIVSKLFFNYKASFEDKATEIARLITTKETK
jgi:multimeric flavodoxin WrbA